MRFHPHAVDECLSLSDPHKCHNVHAGTSLGLILCPDGPGVRSPEQRAEQGAQS